MLVVDELVRDVLCNELIELNKSLACNLMSHAREHVTNISNILMSPYDFIHVDISVDDYLSQKGE